MKTSRSFLFLFLLSTLVISMSGYSLPKKKRVLVFSKTAGFRHGSSIEAGKKIILELGQKNKFGVDTTENPGVFTS